MTGIGTPGDPNCPIHGATCRRVWHKDPLRHLETYRSAGFMQCPYCGEWLYPNELHRCSDLDDIAPRRDRRLPDLLTVLAVALALFAAMYLGAHLLVAAGVGCPGGSS